MMSEQVLPQVGISKKRQCTTQNGSQSKSTKLSEGSINHTSPNSSQSNDSSYAPTQYDQPTFSMDLESDSETIPGTCHDKEDSKTRLIESRVSELLELAQNGSLEQLKISITTLIRENEELKEKLNEMQCNFDQSQKNSITESKEAEDGFCIDSTPSQLDISLPETSSGVENGTRINYEVINFGDKLLCSKVEGTKVDKKSTTSGNCCFNCLGNHMMTECKEPKDYKTINKNRRSFQSRQGVTSARYHVEEQKFNHIQPGQAPSRALRKALGLRDDRYLPPYIYQMRKLGYPPAWLKYAQINPSGLSLYVSEGTKLEEFVADVQNGEDGEISFVENCKKNIEYEVEKLIGWQGFNVEPTQDYKEESRFYRAPPLQLDRTTPRFESLDTMKNRLSAHQQKGYVRGEMQNTNVVASSDSQMGMDDNDTEPPGVSSAENGDEGKPIESPKFRQASVKTTDHGTPIVDTYSPYNELPASDKWTCYTTDHIFFENLPESTGKYENMVGILKKCREAKKEIEKLGKSKSTLNDMTPSGN